MGPISPWMGLGLEFFSGPMRGINKSFAAVRRHLFGWLFRSAQLFLACGCKYSVYDVYTPISYAKTGGGSGAAEAEAEAAAES